MEDYRCIHVTKILCYDCNLDSLIMHVFHNEYIKFKKIILKKMYINWFMHMSKWIHPFDNYIIWPGSLALMNREPITSRNLLMRARLQDQKVCVT
jgi:hypothetical protein